MKIKFRTALLFQRKSALLFIMKSLIFFFCTTVFSLSSLELTSQNTKITIDADKVATVEEVFDLIDKQTDYSFVYKPELITKLSTVILKKGIIQVDELIQKSLSNGNFNISINKNKTIYIEEKIQKEEPITFQKAIKGTVVDPDGIPLPGVNIVIVGTSKGTQTDFDGNYTIAANSGDVLRFSSVGFKTKDVTVGSSSTINLTMQEDLAALDAVVVVGYGTQKKESVVGAISTIKPSELKIPSSNLTTALAGRLSGVVAFQSSGEPGQDNAQFFVRGVASFNGQNGPLILIDGVELTADDLARLQPDDIESFSVLKDPTTTAIYGARGANGIILVTTRSGVKGKVAVSLRVETAISQPFSQVQLADPITYMRLQNEADRTRIKFPTFTQERIASTERGLNPNAFPQVDWFDELFQDFAVTKRVNLNVRGGGDKVRYYVAGAVTTDGGLLKVDNTNNFTNNIKLNRYSLRANVNVDLHENTEMIVRLHTTIDDYRGPLQGGNAIYNTAVRTSPVRFPAVFEPTSELIGVPHILFGNDTEPRGFGGGASQDLAAWFNPYAELQRGYRDNRRQLSLVQLEFKQDLSSILPGLSARFLGNANTTSSFENRRSYRPFFYRVSSFDPVTQNYTLARTVEGNEALGLDRGRSVNNSVFYMEAAVNYANTFNEKHNVSGLLVFTGREFLDGNTNEVQLSLPSRNITTAGRFNYDYDNRYFAEFNFGYNGSERFAKNNRFGFFPSFGVGWLVSNESFFKSNVISRLKFRASYGIVGNDNIGNGRTDRFFYLSRVNTDNPGRGYTFGTELNERINGVSIARYANPLVTWETSRKANFGLELNLFDDAVQFRTDVFQDERSNILQTREDIPTTLGLQTGLATNVGQVLQRGIDASLDVNHTFNENFWLSARATFVYSDNEFTVFEEPNFAGVGAPWRSNIGNNVSVRQGYIAERLFVDDEEAINSPVQFGNPGVDYGGGDIKYKDLNGDGKISKLDRAPIGKPEIPKITYGFGFSGGYKGFDMSCFFQGLAEVSFAIDPISTGPFINSVTGSQTNQTSLLISDGNGLLSENGLIKAFADDHWSEDNRNVYAQWTRLSTTNIENNTLADQRREDPNLTSTWWLRDGSFMRLKQVEIGYNFLNDESLKKKLNISKLRLYLSGTNLVTWSKFKLWDPELKGNGLNYPLQRVFNLGLQMGF